MEAGVARASSRGITCEKCAIQLARVRRDAIEMRVPRERARVGEMGGERGVEKETGRANSRTSELMHSAFMYAGEGASSMG